ncbi:aquaporin [Lysobacter auxotrophicus]|uniref:Aquaporin family protein n=1 Tax=Lysobacter auxotrophicus TaxID=2992573 RepID=A0ABN6UP43_9GAMM|nr:MIP/aquaporin family protein [Lysobacter auxotrophicus]BDU18126.1 aquaporin family protein [Lysobacter auxotrophicus]
MPLSRRLAAEFIGTMFLLAAVVGSGIMGVLLSQGNNGIALLANAAATAGILYVLIVIFGPISGAHFNPAVSFAMHLRGELGRRDTVAYIAIQVVGAALGVVLAHAMFGLALVQAGTHVRSGWPQWLSEAVATSGLLLTIVMGVRNRPQAVPALVASYIFAAYWFTGSTSLANPAVTLARALTSSFAGIRLVDVVGFVAAQMAGLASAVLVLTLVLPEGRTYAARLASP